MKCRRVALKMSIPSKLAGSHMLASLLSTSLIQELPTMATECWHQKPGKVGPVCLSHWSSGTNLTIPVIVISFVEISWRPMGKRDTPDTARAVSGPIFPLVSTWDVCLTLFCVKKWVRQTSYFLRFAPLLSLGFTWGPQEPHESKSKNRKEVYGAKRREMIFVNFYNI